MGMSVVYILIGLVLLVVGGEFLVRSSVGLSFKLKLSKMVIGLTVVSFATSAPELLVSVNAALEGFSDISLGNVIGSNIANIGLVLGVTAVIAPLAIDRDFFRFNWPVMVVLSFALFFLLKSGLMLNRGEGVLLFGLLLVYLFILIRRSYKTMGDETVAEEVDDSLARVTNFKIVIWLLIGGAALWGGSELLVHGAVRLATSLGVSERVIAVTMIAIGTSVPELAASVIAAIRREKAISLGNLIGSNIFNIGSVLGITSLLGPISVESPEILKTNLFWMIGFAAVLLPLVFLPKRYRISRYKGFILFASYVAFVFLVLT